MRSISLDCICALAAALLALCSFIPTRHKSALRDASAMITQKKKMKIIARLDAWFPPHAMTRKEAEVTMGTLGCCVQMIKGSRSQLPAVTRFVQLFSYSTPQEKHLPPQDCMDSISWWRRQLAADFFDASTAQVLFVDAAPSFGIGIVLDGNWDCWKFVESYRLCDVNWAEMLAVELGVLAAIDAGCRNETLTVQSDSKSACDALAAGKSRDPATDTVLQRITSRMTKYGVSLRTKRIKGKDNPADGPSRGRAAPGKDRIYFNILGYQPSFVSFLVQL